MSNYYLYADITSLEVLSSHESKIICIGGDLGYGNFGDLLQHINAVRLAKVKDSILTVSVLSAKAISHRSFSDHERVARNTDAVVFISDCPLFFTENDPGLRLVDRIINATGVYLYGGGFLNTTWGDFHLSLVEFFLNKNPNIPYWISGQQITRPFESRVIEHLRNYHPRLFGVRDEISWNTLKGSGVEVGFSFDDATESIFNIKRRLGLKKGKGLLIHLNASDYATNDIFLSEFEQEMGALQTRRDQFKDITILQAYRDSRESIYDSVETIKSLDYIFPFNDARLINLVGFLEEVSSEILSKPIMGAMGYSCSYHVALTLQLSGMPCWLRSKNDYYRQKADALQCYQTLEEFLENPMLADHSLNLERRYSWVDALQKDILSIGRQHFNFQFTYSEPSSKPHPFSFKGRPHASEGIAEADTEFKLGKERNDLSNAAIQKLREEYDGLQEINKSLVKKLRSSQETSKCYAHRLQETERLVDSWRKRNKELEDRALALMEQLTLTGNRTRKQLGDFRRIEKDLIDARSYCNDLEIKNSLLKDRGEIQKILHIMHNGLRVDFIEGRVIHDIAREVWFERQRWSLPYKISQRLSVITRRFSKKA